jgi:hypothetical protein
MDTRHYNTFAELAAADSCPEWAAELSLQVSRGPFSCRETPGKVAESAPYRQQPAKPATVLAALDFAQSDFI